jgi:hypothetical protein
MHCLICDLPFKSLHRWESHNKNVHTPRDPWEVLRASSDFKPGSAARNSPDVQRLIESTLADAVSFDGIEKTAGGIVLPMETEADMSMPPEAEDEEKGTESDE